MRTQAIEAAFDRFEATLAPRLGLSLTGTRVTSDDNGFAVTASAEDLVLRSVERDGVVDWRLEGAHAESARPRLADAREAMDEALATLRHAIRSEPPQPTPLTASNAKALLGDGTLAATVDAFARHYGAPLETVSLPGDDVPSVRFPAVVRDQELLMFAPAPFREDARMRAYLSDLGFAIDADHRVSTVPLPASFERRRRRLGALGGLEPELVRLRWPIFSPRGWLRRLSRGVIPVNIDGRLGRALGAASRRLPVPGATRAYLHNHFHALGHDVGMHALAMHRVPTSQMSELRRLARAALRRGRAEGAARFFEERLTRACVDAWADVRRPEAFAARFERDFAALRRELAREAGLG